jgi:propionyl-CoA carboxylase alpha chain
VTVPIRTLLVANRGEIAVRVLRAAHELGMRSIAVYSEVDRGAAHTLVADVAVALGGSSAAESYLDGDRIIEAARGHGADAVHPGYGFLAEDARFARAVIDAGLTWVGPHPDAIATMGDKIAAKRLASGLGVGVLPSAELIGDAAFEWRAQAATVGYPLLVKAAAGGGGRGMRLVMDEDGLEAAVVAARREALDSFGDARVFAERWLASPRHVEVQVVADRHGNTVHLGERECSIQRRHQKLIEEAPSPAVDDVVRDQMTIAAVRLAEAIDYDSVGTIEFLLDADDGTFYFLEMNTRLQVEHRVTELVTGVDLVATQLQAAQGEPLPFAQDDVELQGHAIEARLVAEDPALDWLPSSGVVHRFWFPDHPNVLCDHAVVEGRAVATEYDSLLAKVVSGGATRDQAIGVLEAFLQSMHVHGLRTNRDHLAAVLTSDDFVASRTTTAFTDLNLTLLDARPGEATVAAHLLAATLWRQYDHRDRDRHTGLAPTGWRNVPALPQDVELEEHGTVHRITYELRSPDTFRATVDDRRFEGVVIGRDDDAIHLEIASTAMVFWVNRVSSTWYVNSRAGQSELVEVPRFVEPGAGLTATGPTAPVPGRVVSIEVSVGDTVTAGQTLVVMEAMKVEHRITAASDGKVVEVLAKEGDRVDAHALLVRLEAT